MTDAAPTKSIEEQLKDLQKASADQAEQLQKDTEQSKLLGGLKSDVEAIAKKKTASVQNYRAKHGDLLSQWQSQDTELERLKAEIIALFPDYATRINTKVCPVKNAIDDQQTKVTTLTLPKSQTQNDADAAKLAADASKTALDDWLTADTKLAARLKDIDTRIKNLQPVIGGVDSVLSIYLLWFEILPLHQEIAPRGGASTAPATAASGGPECLPKPNPDAVYLISPDDYGEKLDAAWQAYRTAREALKKADDALKTAQKDFANATKDLKTLQDNQDADAKAALKSQPATVPSDEPVT
jgi:chromosome segregation ATPase